jgi:hypothetical protein
MESDGWTVDESRLLGAERLAEVERVLEHEAPVIVEHRFYRGSRAPNRLVFDDYGDFLSYLRSHANAGDAFHIWNFDTACRNDNRLVTGKWPDKSGRTPARGPY